MKTELLVPGRYYHIYNHANGQDNLFLCHDNYLYFLKKYAEYIAPIADTYAYCLMPNHFHLAIRVKIAEDLTNILASGNHGRLNDRFDETNVSILLSQQFSNLFNAYSKAFNKKYERTGNLFVHKFKRKEIADDIYFKTLIHYIHRNPVHHQFASDLRDWKYSSFESYCSESATRVARDEALSWFGGRTAFLDFHNKHIDEKIAIDLENW